MRKIFILLSLIFTLISGNYGMIYMNNIVCPYQESPDKSQIVIDMIEGSHLFLQAQAETFNMLRLFELSELQEFNYSDSLQHLSLAIQTLNNSLEHFENARDIGKRLGYIESRKNKFLSFNYDSFIEYQKLNPIIAGKVKSFLSKGDILGVYQQNIDNIKDISVDLTEIHEALSQNQKPKTSACWRLIQKFSETVLFGNYATMMGNTILENCPPD